MNKGLAVKGATLIAVGALGLIGLGALGPVFGPGKATADTAAPGWQRETAAISVATQPTTTDPTATDEGTSSGVRDQITDMIRDHMGLTGEQADQFAATMEDTMRSMHGDQVDEMLQYCDEIGGAGGMMDGSAGGMMGGSGSGMMGDWNGGGSADGTGWGGMMGGSGSGSGGGMMGGSGTN